LLAKSCLAGVAARYCVVADKRGDSDIVHRRRRIAVTKLTWIFMLAALAAVPATSETAIPDLRGTWTGQSESIVLGRGNPASS